MQNRFKRPGEPLRKKLLRWIATGLVLLLFALLIDWLIFNLLLGCCEGGVCWPDIYPQCRNDHYREFYGEHYGKE